MCPRSAAAAALLAAALLLTACGGSSETTSTANSSSKPTDGATSSAIVVVRTGGIAGVQDMVRVAADGSATLTSKTGKSHACTPSAKSLDQLRAIDLTAVGTTSKPPQMADGFNYSVKSGDASATASQGDDDSRRADLVDAAAAVVASCLARQS
jgi:hypothetical protein